DCNTPVTACDLDQALGLVTTNRFIVKLTGTAEYNRTQSIILNEKVTLTGTVTIRTNAIGDDGIIIGAGGDVTLVNLTVRDASGPSSDNIKCEQGGVVHLFDVNLLNADDVGLDADDCTATVFGGTFSMNNGGGLTLATAGALSIEGSTVSGNQGGGISSSGGSLTVSGSTVSGNQGGGISSSGGSFDITNNFIFANGLPGAGGSNYGGLYLPGPTGGRLQFNTIADNLARTSDLAPGGVLCDVPGLVADGNIIFRNRGGTSQALQRVGQCAMGTSVELTSAANVDPIGFVRANMAPQDFHLTAASPATVKNAAGATCAVATDVDGQARPNESGCDIGADEYYPAQ
ncbi:MAG: right-handed parallel beta-helix repeat-containing protein, partial [Kofleriaceae bacterium]|nr:right-handed parallel beta-helix repeat-containing protein [Kofleriaceae bacterium]